MAAAGCAARLQRLRLPGGGRCGWRQVTVGSSRRRGDVGMMYRKCNLIGGGPRRSQKTAGPAGGRLPLPAGCGLPPIANYQSAVMPSWPLELRLGSSGSGAFVGCGFGVGILTPVSLHGVPVLGQLVSARGRQSRLPLPPPLPPSSAACRLQIHPALYSLHRPPASPPAGAASTMPPAAQLLRRGGACRRLGPARACGALILG